MLVAEQGLGDTLQFVRYAALVKQRGGTVLLECPAELVRLLQTCAGIDPIVTPGSPLPTFDVQVPLLSLPGILKTTLATMPAAVPYLAADRCSRGALESGAEPLCGVQDRHHLARQSPVFAAGVPVRGSEAFPAAGAVRARGPRAGSPAVQLAEGLRHRTTGRVAVAAGHRGARATDLNDFADTAAVMMNLDLIISADTSPIHLAGALGKTGMGRAAVRRLLALAAEPGGQPVVSDDAVCSARLAAGRLERRVRPHE